MTATIEELRARLKAKPAETTVECEGLTVKLREMTAADFLAMQEPYQTLALLGNKSTPEDRTNALKRSNLVLLRSRVAEPDLSGFTDDELLTMSPTLWTSLVAVCQQQNDDLEELAKNCDETAAGDSLTA